MKIVIDRDRCVGSAYCQRIAPTLFDLGDDGIAVVLGDGVTGADAGTDAPDAGLDAKAREAEGACPSMAISLLDS